MIEMMYKRRQSEPPQHILSPERSGAFLMTDINSRTEAYLRRLGFDSDFILQLAEQRGGPAKVLSDLQYAHVCHVPYETLDILAGVPFTLDVEAVYDKVVTRGRGGYCFELNGLFCWLLTQLGYAPEQRFARFLREETQIPMRRHRVLKVEAEGRFYLCDVGVGGIAPRWPILLEEGLEQPQGEECYKISVEPFLGWVLWERHHGQWRKLFSFTEEPQLDVDFVTVDYYCQNAPDSHFRTQAMAAIRTPDGRNTLAGDEFRLFRGEQVTAFIPQTRAEYLESLEKYFGIRLDPRLVQPSAPFLPSAR